jgi:regulator of protease activity HflC (stomatin/prohibitin superfamily)
MPFVQSVAKFSVQTQKYSADATAASKDLQTVHTGIAVIYHLNPSSVPKIFTDLGYDYGDRVIQPTVQEVVKASTAKFSADRLITNRSIVADQIQEMLKTRLINYGIIVESTAITNFNFSASFNDAIEAKVTAEQQKQKAEMDLQRIRVEAEQKITTARAEAEALRSQREVVTPELVELRKIEVQKAAVEKWNGVLPTYAGGNAMPLIGVSV